MLCRLLSIDGKVSILLTEWGKRRGRERETKFSNYEVAIVVFEFEAVDINFLEVGR
jgi:hypothetical protein